MINFYKRTRIIKRILWISTAKERTLIKAKYKMINQHLINALFWKHNLLTTSVAFTFWHERLQWQYKTILLFYNNQLKSILHERVLGRQWVIVLTLFLSLFFLIISFNILNCSLHLDFVPKTVCWNGLWLILYFLLGFLPVIDFPYAGLCIQYLFLLGLVPVIDFPFGGL